MPGLADLARRRKDGICEVEATSELALEEGLESADSDAGGKLF